MIELTGALSAARAVLDTAKLALDARDDAKLRAALADASVKLTDATMSALASAEKALALHDTIGALKDEIRELKLKATERESYELTALRPGAYAYKSRVPDGGDDNNAHYLCQPCYDKGIKAMLVAVTAKTGTHAHWTCPEGGQKHTIVAEGTALPYIAAEPSHTPFFRR